MKRPVATRASDLPLWLRWTKLLRKLSGPRGKHETALARRAQGLLTTDKVPEWGKLTILNKKSQNGATLDPVELIGWPEQGNQGDQGGQSDQRDQGDQGDQ